MMADKQINDEANRIAVEAFKQLMSATDPDVCTKLVAVDHIIKSIYDEPFLVLNIEPNIVYISSDAKNRCWEFREDSPSGNPIRLAKYGALHIGVDEYLEANQQWVEAGPADDDDELTVDEVEVEGEFTHMALEYLLTKNDSAAWDRLRAGVVRWGFVYRDNRPFMCLHFEPNDIYLSHNHETGNWESRVGSVEALEYVQERVGYLGMMLDRYLKTQAEWMELKAIAQSRAVQGFIDFIREIEPDMIGLLEKVAHEYRVVDLATDDVRLVVKFSGPAHIKLECQPKSFGWSVRQIEACADAANIYNNYPLLFPFLTKLQTVFDDVAAGRWTLPTLATDKNEEK